jgi:uncharacterized SAM-binding protein YcdF (DUF218 family)
MKKLRSGMRYLLYSFGILFLLTTIFAFTTAPFWAFYHLGVTGYTLKSPPAHIVLMGGGGFPSESNLMRAYYAQKAAIAFDSADLIISLPGDTTDSTSSVMKLKNFIVKNGVEASHIRIENKGTNTRGQVLRLASMLDLTSPILVISSPEHMRRCLGSFQKAGFTNVSCLPAFEVGIEADMLVNNRLLGGRKIPGGRIGEKETLRYEFWSQLRYEVIVAREYVALAYYKLKGWI